MKMKGAKQVHYDSGPNMTPLVDVVMVILIFLMLAGSFGANEWFLTSNLPIKKSGGAGEVELKPGELPDELLEVRIDIDNNYGFRVLAGDISSQGRTPEREWLIAAFTKKLDDFVNKANTPVSRVQVVLFPSPMAQYEHITAVYEAALAAKFEKVAFRTSQ